MQPDCESYEQELAVQTQAFSQVGADLGTLEAQRLANNLQRTGSLTDDEACWTTRTLYTQGIALRDRHKNALALTAG